MDAKRGAETTAADVMVPEQFDECTGRSVSRIFIGLVVEGVAIHLMIGLKEGFSDQTSDVGPASGVKDSTAIAPSDNQSGQPQLREVLAGRSRRDSGQRCKRANIELVV